MLSRGLLPMFLTKEGSKDLRVCLLVRLAGSPFLRFIPLIHYL